VAEFLVELYLPRSDPSAVAGAVAGARRAAEELTAAGTPVRFVRSIFVPEDETCFQLFEAASAEAVREAADRAELRVDRISRTDGSPEEGRVDPCRSQTT